MLLYRLRRYLKNIIVVKRETRIKTEINITHTRYSNLLIIVKHIYSKEYDNTVRISYVQRTINNNLCKGINYYKDFHVNNPNCSYVDSLKLRSSDLSRFDYNHFYSPNQFRLDGQWLKIPKEHINLNICAVVSHEGGSISHIFGQGYYMMISSHNKIYVKCLNITEYINEIDHDIIVNASDCLEGDWPLIDSRNIRQIYNIGRPFTLKELANINLDGISYITSLWIEQERKKLLLKLCGRLLAATKHRKE